MSKNNFTFHLTGYTVLTNFWQQTQKLKLPYHNHLYTSKGTYLFQELKWGHLLETPGAY